MYHDIVEIHRNMEVPYLKFISSTALSLAQIAVLCNSYMRTQTDLPPVQIRPDKPAEDPAKSAFSASASKYAY